MRRLAAAAMLSIATALGAVVPAFGQAGPGPPPPTPPVISRGAMITPLGWYAIGSIGCAAVSPMIGTAILGRELTVAEAWRSTLNCAIGPLGWVVGPYLFPDVVVTQGGPPPRTPPRQPGARQSGGRNISIPPPGETRFVADEILLQVTDRASAQALNRIAGTLQLTLLETQSFGLTGRTLLRWRIGGGRSVAATLRGLARYRIVVFAQPNYLYALAQNAPAPAAAPDAGAQYVVSKLRLLEAHRITSGDDVLVAVIDSKIDTKHPDLAGVIAEEYDALGGAAVPPHAHGTAMAGAIAAHNKLIGVAPKVRLLAIRTFTGGAESAQATTFNILKSLDWAAMKHARIVNMSFAGPPDAALRDMIGKAHARGMVLIAAVGNAGPRLPPLYPAADTRVIGVTATDADDKLLPQANRGAQVAIAAPGVEILAAAPDGQYTVTSGTSVAAAHASGVAALLLARKADLTPAALRRDLIRSARKVPGQPREVGAGVIDALGAVEAAGR